VESRRRWVAFSRAKDRMFAITDTEQSPWWVVDAEDKRRARLNCISHLLTQVPYEDVTPKRVKLPPRIRDDYVRPPQQKQTFVPAVY
jgi:lysozyme family protein